MFPGGQGQGHGHGQGQGQSQGQGHPQGVLSSLSQARSFSGLPSHARGPALSAEGMVGATSYERSQLSAVASGSSRVPAGPAPLCQVQETVLYVYNLSTSATWYQQVLGLQLLEPLVTSSSSSARSMGLRRQASSRSASSLTTADSPACSKAKSDSKSNASASANSSSSARWAERTSTSAALGVERISHTYAFSLSEPLTARFALGDTLITLCQRGSTNDARRWGSMANPAPISASPGASTTAQHMPSSGSADATGPMQPGSFSMSTSSEGANASASNLGAAESHHSAPARFDPRASIEGGVLPPHGVYTAVEYPRVEQRIVLAARDSADVLRWHRALEERGIQIEGGSVWNSTSGRATGAGSGAGAGAGVGIGAREEERNLGSAPLSASAFDLSRASPIGSLARSIAFRDPDGHIIEIVGAPQLPPPLHTPTQAAT